MKWSQQNLELMRKEAKREFTQSRPMPCKYCGKVIRCNMYRHVARLHLDLTQLWRCPVSWCTVWRGTPQDWNICGIATMFRGYRRQPASNDSSHLGQCVGNCGRSRCDRNTRAYRYYAIQRPRLVANTPLQGIPGRVATCCISGRLHDVAPCPLADATKYEWGVSVVTGSCTRGDTQIQEAGASAFSTGACDVGGGR